MSNPAAIDLTNDDINNTIQAQDSDDDFIIDDYLADEMYGSPAGVTYGRDAGAWPYCAQCKLRRGVWIGVRDLVDELCEELEFFQVFENPVEVERATECAEILSLPERAFVRAAVTDAFDIVDALEGEVRHNGVIVESTASLRKEYQAMARAIPTLATLDDRRELFYGTLRSKLRALRTKLEDLENRPGPCSAHDDERMYRANLVVILATHTSALPNELRTASIKGAAALDAAIESLRDAVALDGACSDQF